MLTNYNSQYILQFKGNAVRSQTNSKYRATTCNSMLFQWYDLSCPFIGYELIKDPAIISSLHLAHATLKNKDFCIIISHIQLLTYWDNQTGSCGMTGSWPAHSSLKVSNRLRNHNKLINVWQCCQEWCVVWNISIWIFIFQRQQTTWAAYISRNLHLGSGENVMSAILFTAELRA